MRTARFYTGLVMVATLAMAMLMVIPGRKAAPSGRVEGTVTVHGQPWTGGAILFIPEEPQDGEGISATIDNDGHFVCNPGWRRDRAARMRFRIEVMLPREDVALAPLLDVPGAIPEVGGGAYADRIGEGGRGPNRRIARASLTSQDRNSPARVVELGWRRHSSDRCRTEQVWLGPEPAHIDIDLKD
jgi:hypothetical protein